MAKTKTAPQNRIAELRTAKGLTQAGLAKLANTTQPTIARLEQGAMELTEKWMRDLAKVLDCRPRDLLMEANMAEFENEIEPYLPEALSELAAPLASKNLFYYKVLATELEFAGVRKGEVRLFDKSPEAVAAIASGDIVFLRIHRGPDNPRAIYSLLRQYVAPGLFVTNRRGTNFAFRSEGEPFTVEVRGVLVPGRDLKADDQKK